MKYWVNNNWGGSSYYRESEEKPGKGYIKVPFPRPPRIPEGSYSWIDEKWQLAGFIDQQGNYYEGSFTPGAQAVPPPFSPSYLEWYKMGIDNSRTLEGIGQKSNALLAESDYIDLPNTPLDPGVKTQWLTYRQRLRTFPRTVTR